MIPTLRRAVIWGSVGVSALVTLIASTPGTAADTSPLSTVSITAEFDTYVDKATPSTRHDGEPTLLANDNDGWTKYILLSFPEEDLPPGRIVSATLILDRAWGQGASVEAHAVETSFSPAATWNTRPQLGPEVGTADPGWGDGTLQLPLSVNAGTASLDFAVRTPSVEAPARFWSSTGSGAQPALQVTVDTTPEDPSGCSQASVTFNRAMVPSCGRLWGVAANAFSNRAGWPVQGPDSHRSFETAFGRKFGLYAYYYTGSSGALFPRASEITLAREPDRRRVLYMHWKIADDMTFADVVAGKADSRIDREAAYLKANFPEKLFVSLHSEMEPQIRPIAGSGRTAADYAAMYRYVVNRMRGQGVSNIIWVIAYGGYGKWATQPWFKSLYPGDAYVDWIGWHPYSTTLAGGQEYDDLMNSTYGSLDPSYTGMYRALTTRHPGKPLMLSEFGVLHDPTNPASIPGKRSDFYRSAIDHIEEFPAIKAIVNFDTAFDEHKGNGYEITPLADSTTRQVFTSLGKLPSMVNPVPQVGSVR